MADCSPPPMPANCCESGTSPQAGCCRSVPKSKTRPSSTGSSPSPAWKPARAATSLLLRGAAAGHTAGISSLAFTGDGRYLLSSSIDNTARFWDVATRREVARLDFAYLVSLSSKLNRLGVHGINDGTGASIYDATKPEALVPL